MAKKEAAAGAASCNDPGETLPASQVPKERAYFRALITANPNYFGNVAQSPLPPVSAKQGDTTFEEIGCVGFHPQSHRLDAVVFVKQAFGYSGDICSRGSIECVRFYLSFDNGVTWVDQGAASFTVYDVPQDGERQRLEYAIGVRCAPPEKFCQYPNVLLARAILSWDYCPPPNQPDWVPVWGEVHNTYIQVQARTRWPWYEVFNEFKIKLPYGLQQSLDLDQVAVVKPAAELSLAELHALYRDKGVEPKRYALPAVQKLLAQSAFDIAALPPNGLFGAIDIDADQVLAPLLDPGDGNTYYEELECVGFNPVANELIGVLRIKRPNGYSGDPCTGGSREYVTFWADFDANGTWETCLGTASVQVFDIARIPGDGLEYSVYLPVDFSKYRRVCEEGPRLVRIRAVLSWNSIPPCAAPMRPPVWGNAEETLILLSPGKPVVPGDFSPLLFNISTIAVCDIDQAAGPHQGLTDGGDRPFGGIVYIVGDIPGADALPAPDRLKYKLFVREFPGGAWQPLANNFTVSVDEHNGAITTQSPLVQSVDGAGYYTYREYGIGSGTWRRVAAPYAGLLGQWNTALPMGGLWEIRVEALDTFTNVTYTAATTVCPDATTRTNVVVRLDEDPPVCAIAISAFSTDGGVTWGAAADCGEFTPGVWVRGTYSVSDAHFSLLTLYVEPAGPANGATPRHVDALPVGLPPVTSPFPRSYPAVATGGESGEWVLDTSAMDPCGYVVRVDAWDRTIVSANGGWFDAASVGFCLRQPS